MISRKRCHRFVSHGTQSRRGRERTVRPGEVYGHQLPHFTGELRIIASVEEFNEAGDGKEASPNEDEWDWLYLAVTACKG